MHALVRFVFMSYSNASHAYRFPTSFYHFLQESSPSSKTNQSQPTTQKAISPIQVQGFSAEDQSDTQSKELSSVFDLNATKYKDTLREGNSSPQEACEKLSVVTSVTPDLSCQAPEDNQEEQVLASSGSTLISPGSGSNQSSPLGSGREMQLLFSPEALQNREFNDESPQNDQTNIFEDEAEDTLVLNMATAALLVEDKEKLLTDFAQILIEDDPEVPMLPPELIEFSDTSRQSSCDGTNDGPGSSNEPLALLESPCGFHEVVDPSQISELHLEVGESDVNATEQLSSHEGDAKTDERLAHLHQEDSTAYILQVNEVESEVCSHYFSEETSSLNTQDQSAPCRKCSNVDSIQSEDIWSQSLSDATPETVTSVRHFSFEEIVPGPSFSPPPVDSEHFGPSVTTKPETMSNSEEGPNSSPGHVDSDCSSRSKCEYTEVERGGTGSPAVDYSDPEGYFDCKQAPSDLSEPEPEGPDGPSAGSIPEKATNQVLPSSESEDYEDAPVAHEPPHKGHVDSGESPLSSEPSEDESSLCEASQPTVRSADGDSDNYLTRVRRATITE